MSAKSRLAPKNVVKVSSGPLKIKSILVPLDFSIASRKALAYAVTFARQFKAKLTLLHVVEPVATPDFGMSFPLVMSNDDIMAGAKKQLPLPSSIIANS